jgi:7,8-dihydropterin-6-yl-methyl-4-(beta-D-ribofuranosyl)aminobenzene 5'-phosphate synthase
MIVSVLSENTSCKQLPVEHGLSLHIQSQQGEQILFDMGQSALFIDNATRMDIDLRACDFAIISHGHYDHGGGLEHFLQINDHAEVFLHPRAFDAHYSLREEGLKYIGLNPSMKLGKRVRFSGDLLHIDANKTLFANVTGKILVPPGNRLLFGADQKSVDTFPDEQNFILQEDGKTVLFAGCAHNGIVNILHRAEEIVGKPVTHLFGGMHLVKNGLSEIEEDHFIECLANELKHFDQCHFYTMHCTGEREFQKLKNLMGEQISYLSCGEKINI